MKYDLSIREGRESFIHNTESGIYDGQNSDGEEVIVILQKSIGMDVKTKHHSKPNWYEVVEYDAVGWQVGALYEPIE